MVMRKCEYCKHEQDDEVSKICDRCGRRMGRTAVFDTPSTAAVEAEETEDSTKCPVCGTQSRKVLCPNCGVLKKDRNL